MVFMKETVKLKDNSERVYFIGGGKMYKKDLSLIVFLLYFSFVLFSNYAFAAGSPEEQVSTEKSITGLVKTVVIEPIQKAKEGKGKESKIPESKAPKPGEVPEMATIKTDIKEYNITLDNLRDKEGKSIYEIKLMPTTNIKAGNKNIFPNELFPDEHVITVKYKEVGENTTITSVVLEKIKTPNVIMLWSMIIGISITLILFLLLNGILKKTAGVSGLFVGFDKRYSNSKFQMVLWTFAVIFSYVTLYFERFLASTIHLTYSSMISIPENLGILMGISAGSFVGAKAITASKVAADSITKTTGKPSFIDLITNDYKAIDLGDAQMFAWTLIAVSVYLFNFGRMWFYLDPSSEISLPDVDSTLLVLMGVSQAAYIGKKLVTSDKPKITSIDPLNKAKIGDPITINGSGFGNQKGKVFLCEKEIEEILCWYDSIILIKVPDGIQPGKTVICVAPEKKQTVTYPYEIEAKS